MNFAKKKLCSSLVEANPNHITPKLIQADAQSDLKQDKKKMKTCETHSNTKCVDSVLAHDISISKSLFNLIKSALSSFLNYESILVTQHLFNTCGTI